MARAILFVTECDFGADHPYAEYVDSQFLKPLMMCMNSLQQIILIEGFDMELLQVRNALIQLNVAVSSKNFQSLFLAGVA